MPCLAYGTNLVYANLCLEFSDAHAQKVGAHNPQSLVSVHQHFVYVHHCCTKMRHCVLVRAPHANKLVLLIIDVAATVMIPAAVMQSHNKPWCTFQRNTTVKAPI